MLTQNQILSIIQAAAIIPNLSDNDILNAPDLLSSGMIDSLGLTQIIAHLENQLARPIPAHVIRIENFNSVARIQAICLTLLEQP